MCILTIISNTLWRSHKLPRKTLKYGLQGCFPPSTSLEFLLLPSSTKIQKERGYKAKNVLLFYL